MAAEEHSCFRGTFMSVRQVEVATLFLHVAFPTCCFIAIKGKHIFSACI